MEIRLLRFVTGYGPRTKIGDLLERQLRNSPYTLPASCGAVNESRVLCQPSGRRRSGKRRAAGCGNAENWGRLWCRKRRAA
jgi:hypothetical protein